MITQEFLKKIQDFAETSAKYKPYMRWNMNLERYVCALMDRISQKGLMCEEFMTNREVIRKNSSIFSAFRGNSMTIVSMEMALDKDGQSLFNHSVDIYKRLKKKGFFAGDYLTLAALQIAKVKEVYEYEATIDRMKDIYSIMKRIHPWVTGMDDYVNAAMLAVTDISIHTIEFRMKSLEDRLRPFVGKGNQLQALANCIMILNGDDKMLTDNAIRIYQECKKLGYGLKTYSMLALVGLLSMVQMDAGQLAKDLYDAEKELKKCKGFGMFHVGKYQRLMFVSGLYLWDKFENEVSDVSLKMVQGMLIDYLIMIEMMVMTAIIAAQASADAGGD